MLSFIEFTEQTQAQISASAKKDNTALPGTNTASKYAKKVQTTLDKAKKTQMKDVPEIVM